MAAAWKDDAGLFEIVAAELYTAVIGDVLDELGHRRQFLPPGIQPLSGDMRLIGRCMPVLEADVYAERNEERPFGLMLKALDDLKPREVYVVTGSSPTYALWGEIMTAAAIARGASGVVCDGYLRDTHGILAQSFPAFALGSYAQDQRGRGEVIDFRCPIQIGDVEITPGDIIMGDVDGVLVVPQRAEQEAFTRAIEKARTEKTVMDDVRNGMLTEAAFRKHGIL